MVELEPFVELTRNDPYATCLAQMLCMDGVQSSVPRPNQNDVGPEWSSPRICTCSNANDNYW